MQIPYLPLRSRKLPRFMGCSIGHRMEIFETSTLPIPMVPRLHQSNGYIKRKLQGWRVHKCIVLVVQIPYSPLRGNKVPRFMGGNIEPRIEIGEISALPIPIVPRFHKSNGYMKRKLRACRVQKCIALVGADTVLTTACKESTPFHGG